MIRRSDSLIPEAGTLEITWKWDNRGDSRRFLLMYRTKPHSALNDRSSAEILMGRKPRTTHNALLPKDSTFHSSSSCAKRNLATSTTFYVRDHRPNGIWAEGIIRARHGRVLNKVDFWWQNAYHLRPDVQQNHQNCKRVVWVSSWMFLEARKLRKSN